ncbi:MAG: hypothetical protein Q9174_001406 [Haloplaca sp. 1 TL-2023]
MAPSQFKDLNVSVKDEDPHLRSRMVPMKVLVLGYPRTGTSSMQMALEKLGLGPCYHMRTAMNEYPRDNEMWMEAFQAKYDGIGTFGKEHWDQLLGHYSSVCDVPAAAFSAELMKAYPDAKVILTNREIDSWHTSYSKTLQRARKYWLHRVLRYFDWMTQLVHSLREKQWQCLFADDFKQNGRQAMLKHYADVWRVASDMGRDVLEFHIGDGWEPLCHFLGRDVPDGAYPRENEGGDWILKMQERARIRAKAAAAKLLRVGLPTVVLGLTLGFMARTASPRDAVSPYPRPLLAVPRLPRLRFSTLQFIESPQINAKLPFDNVLPSAGHYRNRLSGASS